MSEIFWPSIILGLLVLAAVVIYLNRCEIRARFRRNMPGQHFAGANRNPLAPGVPIQKPLPANYPAMPLPIPALPPEECPVHDEPTEGGPPSSESERAANARACEEAIRADRISRMAERLFVAHPATDPEQIYRDAVRWVDSRVAVALAEHRDPGAKIRSETSGDLADAPPVLCPVCYSLKFLLTPTGEFSCSNCGTSGNDYFERAARFVFCQKHGDPYPIGGQCPFCRPPISLRCAEHAEDFPPDGRCPICADPERRAQFDAGIEEARWKRAAADGGHLSTDRFRVEGVVCKRCPEHGELYREGDACSRCGESDELPYPPGFPPDHWREVAIPEGADGNDLYVKITNDPGNPVTVAPARSLPPPPKRRALDEPLLDLARSLPQPFSAPQAWAAWNAAHPEDTTTRSTVRGVMERHVRNGILELADAGGRGSFNPRTYRIRSESPETSVPAEDRGHEDLGLELAPSEIAVHVPTANASRPAFRCMVHSRDLSEGEMCPECMARSVASGARAVRHDS